MKRLFLFLNIILFLSLQVSANNDIHKETFQYASKDGIPLMLDKYEYKDSIKNKSCVIFLFGGGFVSGKRDRNDYTSYFESLAKNGNVVISIDYRLGLRDLDLKDLAYGGAEAFLEIFIHTLNIAIEDLVDATKFTLDKASEWNIDQTKIIASGSSSGAITALHAEYAICNQQTVAKKLPANFRYAGVISFAGAIFSTNGNLIWDKQPAPTLLFHGSSDDRVPYNAATMYPIGFYGSKYIANQFEEMKVPYFFYDEEYGTHALSTTPMKNQLDIINTFIQEEVIGKTNKSTHAIVKFNDRKRSNTDFTIFDYISSNFGQ